MPKGRRIGFNLELLVAAVFGIFAAAFLAQTWSYNPTAALFPRIVSAAVVLLVVYLISGRLLAARPKGPRPASGDSSSAAAPEAPQRPATPVLNWPAALVSFVAYFLLIYLVGFGIATLFYGLAMPYLMGYRNRLVTIAFALSLSLALVLGFGRLFSVPLPKGILLRYFHS